MMGFVFIPMYADAIRRLEDFSIANVTPETARTPLQQLVQAELLSCVSLHFLYSCRDLADRISYLQLLRIPPHRAESCRDVIDVCLLRGQSTTKGC